MNLWGPLRLKIPLAARNPLVHRGPAMADNDSESSQASLVEIHIQQLFPPNAGKFKHLAFSCEAGFVLDLVPIGNSQPDI